MADPKQNQEKRRRVAKLEVRSLEARLRQQGANSSNLMRQFTEIAESHCSAGRNLEAEVYWLRLLDIAQCSFGEIALPVALLLKRIIAFYPMQGRYPETEPFVAQSLKVWRQMFGDEHLAVGAALNDLGTIRHREGRFREAEEFYLQAIRLFRKCVGDNHPEFQNALENFQNLLEQSINENRTPELSNYPLTQSILKQILTNVREKQLEEHHPITGSFRDMQDLRKLHLSHGKEKGTSLSIVQSLEKTLRQ